MGISDALGFADTPPHPPAFALRALAGDLSPHAGKVKSARGKVLIWFGTKLL